MRSTIAALAFGLSAAAAPAVAQSFPGFYYRGSLGAEYFHTTVQSEFVGIVDLTFGFDPMAAGSLPGIGVEAGVFAYRISQGSEGHVYNLALTTDIWGGRLSVGAPRPGALGYVTNPLPGGSLVATLELGSLTGHIPFSTLINFAEGEPGYGLRYERSAGALNYAASLTRQNWMGTGTNVLSIGARNDIGRAHVFGTFESMMNSSTRNQLTLGASTMVGRVEVGASGSGTAWAGSTAASATVWATVHPIDRLGLTASVLHQFGSGTTYYGLAGSFDLWRNGSLEVGVLASSVSSSRLVSIGLRQRLGR